MHPLVAIVLSFLVFLLVKLLVVSLIWPIILILMSVATLTISRFISSAFGMMFLALLSLLIAPKLLYKLPLCGLFLRFLKILFNNLINGGFMTWLAANWDSVMTLLNAFGLIVVGAKRPRS